MAPQADLPEVRPGDTLMGRYRIEELLGAGGYGAVYRATQLPLGREVAVKVVSTRYDDGVARFEREAAIAQRLEHPNTVRIYDYGTTPLGQPFLVLELLRGRSLERVLAEQGPQPAQLALQITAQILKALMEAHALGIIHRDIKPANVFITSHPGEPTFVKLLDFGLAKELTVRAGGRAQAALTRVGEVMGTPSYMAPEQVTDSPLTPRCDLYAVGLVLVEMLSARTLFTGASPMAIALAQASPKPALLPAQVVGSIAEAVARRAIEKRAERRYASAADMLAHVEHVLRGPAAAPPPAPAPAPARASRRRLALFAIGALLLAALIGAAAAVALGAGGASSKRGRKSAAPRSSGEDTSSGPRASDAPTVRGWKNRSARSFERPEVEAAAARAGYEVVQNQMSMVGGYKYLTSIVRNSACSGSIQIVRFDPETQVAQAYERTPGGRVFVDNDRLLYVALYSAEQVASGGQEKADAACTDPLAMALSR